MSRSIPGAAPILCAPLLRVVDDALLALLASLAPAAWNLPTIVPSWTVRDIAAHLLDSALRKLSLARDACFVDSPLVRSPQDLAALVHRLNREGVAVYRRLSPAVLLDLMSLACAQSARFHESLDPFAPAAFPVSWAGESQSLNWFDTARELTERWHHQQQIRLAVNRPGLLVPHLYHPVLDCFLRGLPHLFRDVDAPSGTTLHVHISGPCGGTWCLARGPAGWTFSHPTPHPPAARVSIPQEVAWILFTKGIDPHAARARIVLEGDRLLAEKALSLTAIVA